MDTEVIKKAVGLLDGPYGESILRHSLRDMQSLVDLGVIRIDVAAISSRLTSALAEPTTADETLRQFGAYHTAQSILRAAQEMRGL